jgi:hypothetical protein
MRIAGVGRSAGARVVEDLALKSVEDLLADQSGAHRIGPPEDKGQRVDDHPLIQPGPHRNSTDPVDGLAERHHVACCRRSSVSMYCVDRDVGSRVHDAAKQGLVEDVLEPDAG